MDITGWLQQVGLERYANAFLDAAITVEILSELTDSDLRELGMPLGARKILLREARTLAHPGKSRSEVKLRRQPPRADRRQLTVMFVDLVGSTALSAALDPEDMRELLRMYQNAVAGEVARFEGYVAKFMGDGVLAYFGWPRAQEDQAERAARAGLAIVAAVAGLATGERQALSARVGVATGLVVVGDLVGTGSAREQLVVGETPHLAARLQAIARPGGLVIAESTRRLIGAVFELEPLGPLALAGFAEPISAFRVASEARTEGRFEARHAGGWGPLVGREQELSSLLDRWRLATNSHGQVVLLSGEAGIGKSRLLMALIERLGEAPSTIMRFHGSPFHTQSALWPVIIGLERAAGIGSGEPDGNKLDKLEALLRRADVNVVAVAPVMAELLGIASDERYAPLRLTPQQRKAQTFRALLGQLEGLARHGAILLLLEDAQWVDPTTLELFEQTVAQIEPLPVLLVVTCRPEFRPTWASRAHATLVALSRLRRSDSEELVEHVTGGKTLPSEVLDNILAKTDGIPLFVEELTKTVLETNLLQRDGARYVLRGSLPRLAIPDTLQGSLLARLDRFANAKEVAQVGAAIGREFHYELLLAVSQLDDEQLTTALRHLVDAELVLPHGIPPDASYTFKHALIREAAYESLLKSSRQELHARIAEQLERHEPDAVSRRPELLAHHLTEARLLSRALEFWTKAGAIALHRSANHEAAAHLDRAVQLIARLPVTAKLKRQEIELQGNRSLALTLTRGLAVPEVEQAQLRASELAREVGDGEGWFRAQWGLWRVYNGRAQSSRAIAVARNLLTTATREHDDEHLLQAHHGLCSSAIFRGEFSHAREHAQQVRSLYDETRHAAHVFVYGGHDACECALNQGGMALWFLGYPEDAGHWREESKALSERLGLPQVVAHMLNWTAITVQLAGDFPGLEAQVDQLSRIATEHGFANWFPEAQILNGWLAAHRDRDHHAVKSMRRFLEQRTASGTLFARTWLWLVLADACLAVGANNDAITAVREGLAGVEATEERFCEAELHRQHAAALLAHDRRMTTAAERALLRAIDAARSLGARMSELRAATDLAQLWVEAGRHSDAHDLLTPVYGWFGEGEATRDLARAREVMEASS